MNALRYHQGEVDRLSRAVRELDEAAGRPLEPSPDREERARRQIEYTTAQLIRHEISMALMSSRLETPRAS
jgi:hypothetical protein